MGLHLLSGQHGDQAQRSSQRSDENKMDLDDCKKLQMMSAAIAIGLGAGIPEA
jgi:hypothetical protein